MMSLPFSAASFRIILFTNQSGLNLKRALVVRGGEREIENRLHAVGSFT